MQFTRLVPSPAGQPRRLMIGTALAVAALSVVVAPSIASASGLSSKAMRASEIRKLSRQDPNRGTLDAAARHVLRRGYLVSHPARYHRQKVRATRHATARQALTSPVTVAGPLAPKKVRSWAGINDVNSAPPDETSAVGTTRYIELVNTKYAIYNKTGNAPVNQGTLNQLAGAASSDFVFDPQIIWDPTTNRFYYAMDDEISTTSHAVLYGWSKTATPASSADWCKYGISSGASLADYPKLGDSRFFGIVGTNLFGSDGHYQGSNILAFKKPAAGTSCPAPQSDNKGISTSAFTPVPANEIDTNATGYAVAVSNTTPGNKLQVFKVTRAANGNPVIATTGTNVNVASYAVPPPVPQKGSTHQIDSSDGRNTQAVAAVDPAHGNKFALWTQHTVKGGAGAEVRWYEINPATHSLLQNGKATNSSLFEFNGAISPNRQVKGATKKGGDAMVMNFNTASSATFPSISMISKVRAGAQSARVSVFNGTKPLGGFDCHGTGPCRWGDYAAATPDPSTANRIWNVSQYGAGTAGTSGPATSRTWNFIASP